MSLPGSPESVGCTPCTDRCLISAQDARFDPAAHRTYLRYVRETDGTAAAAKVVGSRAKPAVALTQPLDQVFNIHRPLPYRLGRAGTKAGMDATAKVMLDGLVSLGKAGGPDLLETVFDNQRSYARHVSKRIADGDIVDEADYRAWRQRLDSSSWSQPMRRCGQQAKCR